jgi:hypothetical protein
MSHTSPTENQITTHCTFTKNPTIHHQSPNNSQQQSTAESRRYHLTNKPLILHVASTYDYALKQSIITTPNFNTQLLKQRLQPKVDRKMRNINAQSCFGLETLLDDAITIPTNSALQAQETENVTETLKLNGYQKHFIEKVVANNHQTDTNAENEIRGSTCLPYVNRASEKVKSI